MLHEFGGFLDEQKRKIVGRVNFVHLCWKGSQIVVEVAHDGVGATNDVVIGDCHPCVVVVVELAVGHGCLFANDGGSALETTYGDASSIGWDRGNGSVHDA